MVVAALVAAAVVAVADELDSDTHRTCCYYSLENMAWAALAEQDNTLDPGVVAVVAVVLHMYCQYSLGKSAWVAAAVVAAAAADDTLDPGAVRRAAVGEWRTNTTLVEAGGWAVRSRKRK
jgi:hypothetical protein